jgi:hypothetical protein
MSDKQRKLEISDFGLADVAVLETAMHLSPILFGALRVAHRLDASHFRIETDAAIERVLTALASDGTQHLIGKRPLPGEFLPIVDKLDLLRKVFIAITIAQQASSRREWERVQSGALVLAASHPLPVEVL